MTDDNRTPTPGGSPQSDEEKAEGAKHRWNILWLIVGGLLYIAVIGVGQEIVLKVVVEANPELKAAVEEGSTAVELTENDKERLRSVLLSHREFIGSLLALILISGLLVGAIVGFFSGGILEGAAALGLAAVFGFLVAGQAVFALAAGPINAGLGALGAILGRKLRVAVKKDR